MTDKRNRSEPYRKKFSSELEAVARAEAEALSKQPNPPPDDFRTWLALERKYGRGNGS